jgi:hypothetical protein
MYNITNNDGVCNSLNCIGLVLRVGNGLSNGAALKLPEGFGGYCALLGFFLYFRGEGRLDRLERSSFNFLWLSLILAILERLARED